jgi:hypothetical protein
VQNKKTLNDDKEAPHGQGLLETNGTVQNTKTLDDHKEAPHRQGLLEAVRNSRAEGREGGAFSTKSLH